MKLNYPSKYPPTLLQKTNQQSNHIITATSMNSQSAVTKFINPVFNLKYRLYKNLYNNKITKKK